MTCTRLWMELPPAELQWMLWERHPASRPDHPPLNLNLTNAAQIVKTSAELSAFSAEKLRTHV